MNAATTFIHPGTLDGKVELDYVKSRIAMKDSLYTSQFKSMKSTEMLWKIPTVRLTIDANSSNVDFARNDARRAYGNALAWYFTDSSIYADQAIANLNAWSSLQSITATNDQNKLFAGWIGSLLGPAADIMLGYSGWAKTDIEKFRDMIKRVYYPLLDTASTWNGNVDLHQISALLSFAVFNEDTSAFNRGLARLSIRIPAYFYLKSDGSLPVKIPGDTRDIPAFWFNPTSWIDGLTQETCRDNNHHAQFALSGAIGAMETAWHQGIDIYSTYQTRMITAMELMALQCTSGSMQGSCANDTTSEDVYNTWEIGYNHYCNRKGVSMPSTSKMIFEKVRSGQCNPFSWNIFYETLTHADIVYSGSAGAPSNHKFTPGLISLLRDGKCQLLSNKDGVVKIETLSINGSVINETSTNLFAGKSRQISIGIDHAPAGIYLVRASIIPEMKVYTLKYVKH